MARAPPAGCARPSRSRRRHAAPDHRSRSTWPCPTAPAAPARCRRRSPRRSAAGVPARPRRQSEVGRSHRKAVDIGAVERRHVDRRHHVLGKRAAKRVGERSRAPRYRARKQGGLEARQRVFARQDGQELVLIEAVGVVRQGYCSCGTHSVPQHIGIDRRCPPQIPPSHREPRARPRRARSHRATIRPRPA